MDDAVRNETSLMMHYRPRLVDLSRLSADRSVKPVGAVGDDGAMPPPNTDASASNAPSIWYARCS